MTFNNSARDAVVGAASVASLFHSVAGDHTDQTALVDGPSAASVTYRDLAEQVGAIAGWLSAHGVGLGDRVAVWAPNVPPVAAFTFAAFELGAAVTGINPAATDDEAERQLRDAGVSAVLAVPELAERAQALGVPTVIALGSSPTATSLSTVLAHRGRAPAVGVDAGALALLPLSSGTTGMPKAVMLSHGNLVSVIHQLRERLGVTDADVTLAVAPFFHILGMTVELLVPLTCGATVVTMTRFEPRQFLALLERHRVTYLAVPPPIASFLATHPAVDQHDLSSLELLASGGAPLDPDLQERLATRLPRCAIGQGWGLTETSGAISVPERGIGASPATVGKPLPGTEVRVVDTETGTPVGPGADGELQARGAVIMQGYLGRPAESDAMIGVDGWLRTGDLGHVDGDGNIVIVDRIKELIKVNAYQVAPTEVERALIAHPGVADAAVVGRPDERCGEVPVAFVVLRAATSTDELRRWLQDRLAPYKHPAEFHTVDSLPRTPSGKLLRRTLHVE